MNGFERAWQFTIVEEGGYSNDLNDNGGKTRFGITEAVARANGYKGDMRHLPEHVAKLIGRTQYWDKFRCGELPDGIAWLVFDIAYNGGHPIKWLQAALGVTTDGKLGPVTIQAAHNADTKQVIMRMIAYRITYYTSLGDWKSFGKGWARRCAKGLLNGA